ncbi:MAG TPA: hypothetical protein PKD53_14190 [Chloroflexaceae bacterium]|nr:hypothetical protein [Chloroflexaceae bacterium]
MTDADLIQMLEDAEQQRRRAELAETYARGRADAIRAIIERLQQAGAPAPVDSPAEEPPA